MDEINALGGQLTNAYGISIEELQAAIPCGINKINVDTDIRLAVTRNMKELFAKYPEKRNSASIGAIYELLESKKDQVDPRASCRRLWIPLCTELCRMMMWQPL